MKICFICESPYQLLNSINYVYHQTEFTDAIFDMFIGNVFSNSKQIAERLAATNLFNKVCTYNYEKDNILLKRILRAISPIKYLQICLNENFIPHQNYDFVCFSFFGNFPIEMLLINKQAKYRYFEDGMAAYVNEKPYIKFSRLNILLCKMTGRHPERIFFPDKKFVNNIDFVNFDKTEDFVQLPYLNRAEKRFFILLSQIFNYTSNETYLNHNLVYISKPNDGNSEEVKNIDLSIENCLIKFSQYGVVRPHPRIKDFVVGDMMLDTSRNIWELICLKDLTKEHILVGWFSTAQFTTKIIL